MEIEIVRLVRMDTFAQQSNHHAHHMSSYRWFVSFSSLSAPSNLASSLSAASYNKLLLFSTHQPQPTLSSLSAETSSSKSVVSHAPSAFVKVTRESLR